MTLRTFFILPFLILLAIRCPAAYATNLSAGLQAAMAATVPGEGIPVIINLKGKVDISAIQEKGRSLKKVRIVSKLKEGNYERESLKAYIESKGAKKIRQLWIINGIAASMSSTLILELSNRPDIESITLDGIVNVPRIVRANESPAQWNMNIINAPELWSAGFTGQGIVVANMDTGVDLSHPDLFHQWRGGSNSWFNPFSADCMPPNVCSSCDASREYPCDIAGHGTATMGIMVGGDAGGTFIGVAPGAQWIAAKVFNDSGSATFSAIHAAFQWLLDPDGNPSTDDAPDVVDISWSFNEDAGECITEFQTDTEILRAAGIVFSYSAGNTGPRESTSVSPSNYRHSFAVGAATINNIAARFSSRGPSACDGSIFPEIVAPGMDIKTSMPSGGGYVFVQGTSFSAPHAAGAMALLLSAFPEAMPEDLEWALKISARDLGSQGPDNLYGYGHIDVLNAYSALGAISPDILPSPLAVDFGSVETGSSSFPVRVTLLNEGAREMQVSVVSLAGHNSDSFHISEDTCIGEAISPSSTCFVDVLFLPLFPGAKAAQIEISIAGPNIMVARPLLSGNGLPCAVSLQDVPPGYWGEGYIKSIYCNGITKGCSHDPLGYCPRRAVSRSETAAFIVRSLFGENFAFSPSPLFADVPADHWAFKYIQKMFEEGISTGYADGVFRPSAETSRAEAAVFFIRSLHGDSFPFEPGPHFSDIPHTHRFFRYIQKMFEEGISLGYQDGTFRPEIAAGRDEMAAFIGRAFLGMP